MGWAIKRPDTAFSLSPSKGKRRPRQEDDAHLKWIRTLPCVITGQSIGFYLEWSHAN